MRERILITGPGGRVGTHIVPLLREHFALRLLDVKPLPVEAYDEMLQADIRDFTALRNAWAAANQDDRTRFVTQIMKYKKPEPDE